MENLTRIELERLARHQGEPSVSFFMPAHRRGAETQQDPIRFGNLLRSVENALAERGMRTPDVKTFLAPARALLENRSFWQHQQDGLAVFLDSEQFHAYRLPLPVAERLVVGERFLISPLLPLFTNDGHFYILALSQNGVRVFEATRFTVGEIDLPEDAPASRSEMPGEEGEKPGLQARTAGGAGAGRTTMFHGQGGGGEMDRMRIGRFLNELDKGLQSVFRDGSAPLVVAGVDYLLPIYREVSNYAHVVPTGPEGNPELLRPDELHALAWPHVEEGFRAAVDGARASYAALAGTGRTGAGLDEIVPAALFGRVDTLLVPANLEIWGTVDAGTGRVTRSDSSAEGAVELEGFAAAETLLNGGTVFAVDADSLPAGAEAIAVFRY